MTKISLRPIAFMLFAGTVNANDRGLESVSELRWQHRVILVNSDGLDRAALLEDINERTLEIEQRDVLWFVLSGTVLLTNYQGRTAQSFEQEAVDRYFSGSTKVVLIGKDGGVKNRQQEPDLDALLAQIDTMPMRRLEMKRDAASD